MLVLTFGALILAIYSSLTLVSLLLLGFAGISHLFPGVVLGLFSKRVTTSGVFAGIAAGIPRWKNVQSDEVCELLAAFCPVVGKQETDNAFR